MRHACAASVLATFVAGAASSAAIHVDGSAAKQGRRHDGIGGLSNSCAPWLYSYPEPQRSDILDYLFKPGFGASVQVLKLEIGGDAHSTINTESSHQHSADGPVDMRVGWEWWLAVEAKKRNPSIVISALPWGYPGWIKTEPGGESLVYNYLISWVQGMKSEFDITVDYLGLHNEGVPGGSPDTSVQGLRAALDAAGHDKLAIVSDDSHDFGVCSQLKKEGVDSDFFKAVDVIGIHEPLRSTESVPDSCLASGKPIWSSEAYTTYSDSNGGGCWARALNWGWVKGSVTAHMAWNLIQSYPTTGSGMNYNGHGLMWADVPWSGHYVVNSPIWVTAHYTQTTEVGWMYLPVGSGSGDLPKGGTFLTMVSDPDKNGKRDFSLVAQTMEYSNSKCFKDSHAAFTVENQSATFILSSDLLPASGSLCVRWTQLYPDDPIDPYVDLPGQRNTYFEEGPAPTADSSGAFTLVLPINSLVTVSTRCGGKGQRTIPKTTPFSEHHCDKLNDSTTGVGGRYFIDQQGVFETAADVLGGKSVLLQQVVPVEPDEWHGWGKIQHPQTFVGPPVTEANISCSVRPVASGFAGVGVGFQATTTSTKGTYPNMLAVFADGSWAVAGKTGSVEKATTGWYDLELQVAADGGFVASIGGSVVATGQKGALSVSDNCFAFLGSAYGSGHAFRDMCLETRASPAPPAPTPPTPTPPTPGPPPDAGLVIAPCADGDLRQAWVFTGEDSGESGMLQPTVDETLCLDFNQAPQPALTPCASSGALKWMFDSKVGTFASESLLPCLAKTHGDNCHMCLDGTSGGKLDIFDCKQNANQKWAYDPAKENPPSSLLHNGKCLGAYISNQTFLV